MIVLIIAGCQGLLMHVLCDGKGFCGLVFRLECSCTEGCSLQYSWNRWCWEMASQFFPSCHVSHVSWTDRAELGGFCFLSFVSFISCLLQTYSGFPADLILGLFEQFIPKGTSAPVAQQLVGWQKYCLPYCSGYWVVNSQVCVCVCVCGGGVFVCVCVCVKAELRLWL